MNVQSESQRTWVSHEDKFCGENAAGCATRNTIMMIDQISGLWEHRPFEPFEIALADGSVHLIENPKWMMISADERTLTYVNREGPSHRLATHLITRVSERSAAKRKSGGRKRA